MSKVRGHIVSVIKIPWAGDEEPSRDAKDELVERAFENGQERVKWEPLQDWEGFGRHHPQEKMVEPDKRTVEELDIEHFQENPVKMNVAVRNLDFKGLDLATQLQKLRELAGREGYLDAQDLIEKYLREEL